MLKLKKEVSPWDKILLATLKEIRIEIQGMQKNYIKQSQVRG